MTQFHEGQDVEVETCSHDLEIAYPAAGCRWRKAKVVNDDCIARKDGLHCYLVQFPDGTRAIFDAEHVRHLSMATQLNDASR